MPPDLIEPDFSCNYLATFTFGRYTVSVTRDDTDRVTFRGRHESDPGFSPFAAFDHFWTKIPTRDVSTEADWTNHPLIQSELASLRKNLES